MSPLSSLQTLLLDCSPVSALTSDFKAALATYVHRRAQLLDEGCTSALRTDFPVEMLF